MVRRCSTPAGAVIPYSQRERAGCTTPRLERELPGLADEIVAKAVVRLRAHQREARLLIEVTGRGEGLLGPERERPIAQASRGGDALGDQPTADPESADRGLYQEESQLGYRACVSYQDHR